MEIYVVQPGDSLYAIARRYGVSLERLIQDNGLLQPDYLVAGQTIVVQKPLQTHTVQTGETLYGIAQEYNISLFALMRNNPGVLANDYIYPGENLVIRYENNKLGTMAVKGYTGPGRSLQSLRQVLPYLTYLSIFAYSFTAAGDLVPIQDDEVIRQAWEYRAAPLLVLAPMDPNWNFSQELNTRLLQDAALQDKVIAQLQEVVERKQYYGVDVDFEFVGRENREGLTQFVRKLRSSMDEIGRIVTIALPPKTSDEQQGHLYEGHDYRQLGELVNRALLMTYDWGYPLGPPMAVAPQPEVRRVVEYAKTRIPDEKLLLGIANYGYNWPLPFVVGKTVGNSVGNMEAVDLAWQYHAAILYDEVAQSPYFHYFDRNKTEHVVWFQDARSVRAGISLVNEYGIFGIGIWEVDRYFPQLYRVINDMYDVWKIME